MTMKPTNMLTITRLSKIRFLGFYHSHIYGYNYHNTAMESVNIKYFDAEIRTSLSAAQSVLGNKHRLPYYDIARNHRRFIHIRK